VADLIRLFDSATPLLIVERLCHGLDDGSRQAMARGAVDATGILYLDGIIDDLRGM
jgi:hypothetical protein